MAFKHPKLHPNVSPTIYKSISTHNVPLQTSQNLYEMSHTTYKPLSTHPIAHSNGSQIPLKPPQTITNPFLNHY